MHAITMVALVDFPYNKRSLKAGDIFEAVKESDAAILATCGRAKLNTEEQSKRHYLRRDMTAKARD